MTGNTQKLSIRLLKDGLLPCDSLRDDVKLANWNELEGAEITLGTMGGSSPKWHASLSFPKKK